MTPRKAAPSARARAKAPAKPRATKKNKSVDWTGAFLAGLAATGTIKHAAAVAGIDRGTATRRRRGDPAFADAWARAEIDAADALEEEARRRAIEGTVRAVYGTGRDAEGKTITVVVGAERVYSDRLLEVLLKARKPDVFATRIDLREISESAFVAHLEELEAELAARGGEVPSE